MARSSNTAASVAPRQHVAAQIERVQIRNAASLVASEGGMSSRNQGPRGTAHSHSEETSSKAGVRLHAVGDESAREAKDPAIEAYGDEQMVAAPRSLRSLTMALWIGIGILTLVLVSTVTLITVRGGGGVDELPPSMERARFYR